MTDLATNRSFNDDYQNRMDSQLNNDANYSPKMIDKGATMRLEYETKDKPFLIEEANAQGLLKLLWIRQEFQ